MNKEQILKIKADKRFNYEIAREFNISVSTVFHIKHGAENRMLYSARERVKAKGLECTIGLEDIIIPEICPLLEIPIETYIGTGAVYGQPNSPSLDRIDATHGYVKGNVWVISQKANSIKNAASFEEFEKLYQNWRSIRG